MSIEAEWIEWKGGECPVKAGTLVDARDADGCEWIGGPALEVDGVKQMFWKHDCDPIDAITAYRIHNAFEGAPDEATHLLKWNGQTSFAREYLGEYFRIDGKPIDGFTAMFIIDGADPWKVIATRKRPQPKVVSQESYFDKGMKYTKSHVTYDDGESCRQSEPVTAHNTVQAALKHMQDRAATYDKPTGERSMSATVEAFNAIAGTDLTEEHGWMFMALLKIVRSQQGEFKTDNYEDLAAYAGLMAEAGYSSRGA